MISIFDGYELRARLFPSFIIISPLLLPLIPVMKILELELTETIYLVVLFFAINYLVAMLLRFKGKKIERGLWDEQGGAPSSQLLTQENNQIGYKIKEKLRKKIQEQFDIEIIPSSSNEKEQIGLAFVLVKSLLRNESGLMFKHLYEYGFFRNLYGGYYIWLLTTLISIIVSGILTFLSYSYLTLFSLIICCLYFIIVLSITRKGLKEDLKKSAFIYAETAWISYYHYKED